MITGALTLQAAKVGRSAEQACQDMQIEHTLRVGKNASSSFFVFLGCVHDKTKFENDSVVTISSLLDLNSVGCWWEIFLQLASASFQALL